MYLPSHFEETRPEVLHGFVARYPFGLFVTQSGGELAANGLPFLLDIEGGRAFLRGHVARANPVWRDAAAAALVVFQGPHGYVSPAWYASKAEHGKVVPTWNYLTVQARGPWRAIEDTEWLRQLVTRLTDRHEAPQQTPWHVSDAPPAYVDTMLKAIVGIEIEVLAWAGKWKVTQNRSAADREGVARALEASASEMAAALASQVRAPGG